VGDPILERLQKQNTRCEGYQFTSPSKQRLMEGLAVAIQRREVTYPDGPIVNELEAYEYVYSRTGVRYSGPEGLHDDCVCALALAVYARGTLPPPAASAIVVAHPDAYHAQRHAIPPGYGRRRSMF